MDYRHKLSEVKKLHESANLLAEKLNKIIKSPEYSSVFVMAHNHGFPYTGETFGNELKDLEKALKELE